MLYPSLNDLMKKVDSRYTLAVAVAKRARQLVSGAKPLIPTESTKPVTIATEEINGGKVLYKRTKEGIK
jgi:DNA-directed RNA polymerase subunit omega